MNPVISVHAITLHAELTHEHLVSNLDEVHALDVLKLVHVTESVQPAPVVLHPFLYESHAVSVA